MVKQFILNADDFGMSQEYNRAVLSGINDGILTSASLCANGEAFEEAIGEILPNSPDLTVGIHLNIIEGTSLTECPLLTDNNRIFNNGYISLILKSFNKDFMAQVEQEFRAQIEKIMNITTVGHIDSHVHTHAIPNIFRLTAKLAKEYGIPYIRTQFEKPYFTPSLEKHLNLKYPPNILKIILLNSFTLINKPVVNEYGLKTNDYLIGVGYTGMMDNKTIEYGLKSLKKDCLAEALIHPCKYDEPTEDNNHYEYLITQNRELGNIIKELGFELTNQSNITN
jgi:predicted glycoside hydrolase/deacetylase ChbG (UPF0249 family)